MLRARGAREVHFRVGSPPVTHPCFYGIDTPSRRELIGALKTVDEIRDYLGVDSLGYLSLEGLLACEREPDALLPRLLHRTATRSPVDPTAGKLAIEQLAPRRRRRLETHGSRGARPRARRSTPLECFPDSRDSSACARRRARPTGRNACRSKN